MTKSRPSLPLVGYETRIGSEKWREGRQWNKVWYLTDSCNFHFQGDTQIRYFEITDKSPYCFYLSMHQSNQPQRGLGSMPKRELDYMNCEVMRFYKLNTKGIVEPISMTVPRKVGTDQRGRQEGLGARLGDCSLVQWPLPPSLSYTVCTNCGIET